MNTLLFNTGGFPLQTEHLDFLQKSYKESGLALGGLAGTDCIMSGCTVTGSTTSDGYVSWDGEVYLFKGGTTSSYVILVEETEQEEYEDGNLKDTKVTRYITFGTGVGQKSWSTFKVFWTAIQNSTRRFVTDADKSAWNDCVAPSSTGATFTDANGPDTGLFYVQKLGNFASFQLTFKWTPAMRVANYLVFTIPSGFTPSKPSFFYMVESGQGAVELYIDTNGEVRVWRVFPQVYSNSTARLSGIYQV